MLEDIYYLSGILLNAGLMYGIYRVVPLLINSFDGISESFVREKDVLIKKEEEGERNLHSSQSVKSLVLIDEKQNIPESTNEEKEEQIENRLKMINGYAITGRLSEYLSYVVGKKKEN